MCQKQGIHSMHLLSRRVIKRYTFKRCLDWCLFPFTEQNRDQCVVLCPERPGFKFPFLAWYSEGDHWSIKRVASSKVGNTSKFMGMKPGEDRVWGREGFYCHRVHPPKLSSPPPQELISDIWKSASIPKISRSHQETWQPYQLNYLSRSFFAGICCENKTGWWNHVNHLQSPWRRGRIKKVLVMSHFTSLWPG